MHTDGAYLLLAGGARCVRGRVANCRADPMVASSSAAATDPLLFFAGPGTPPPYSVDFLALICGRTASGALRPSTRQIGGAAISPLNRRSGTRWPCSSDQEHLKEETRLRPTLGINAPPDRSEYDCLGCWSVSSILIASPEDKDEVISLAFLHSVIKPMAVSKLTRVA